MTCFLSHCAQATRAQVFSEVDSAYASGTSMGTFLPPKYPYLRQTSAVPCTIAFSCGHGAASLLNFLSAQAEYLTPLERT
jgi:hypothetical protein